MKVDVSIGMASPLDAVVKARDMMACGVDGLFSFENAHDVFFPLVLASQAVRAELMTNVAMAFPRSPLHLAYAANDLQTFTEGGFRLGLGSQIKPHIEKRYGTRWGKPVAQMRESVQAVKMILDHFAGEGEFRFEGEYNRHTLMTPNFHPGPNPYGKPAVLVGALGPKMSQMAAEVADGVLVMPFNSARHMEERTVPALTAGLRNAGRTGADFEVIIEVICAVGRDDAEIVAAANGVRNLLAFYGSTPSYRPVLDVEGWGAYQPRLNALSKLGDWPGMAELITDEMVSTISVWGRPKEVAFEILDRYGDYASRACLYFPGYPVADETIAELVSELKAEALRRDLRGGLRP